MLTTLTVTYRCEKRWAAWRWVCYLGEEWAKERGESGGKEADGRESTGLEGWVRKGEEKDTD